VVPLAALEPFRVAGRAQDSEPLPYLRTSEDWALDVALEVEVAGEVVSRGNARGLYWNVAQQLAHATVNGASVRPGDLLASGTISGAGPGSEGSLLELGRGFLADGDAVVLRGWCGEHEVSFGEVTGTILPAGSQ
jgi:fumarylacetoacetase